MREGKNEIYTKNGKVKEEEKSKEREATCVREGESVCFVRYIYLERVSALVSFLILALNNWVRRNYDLQKASELKERKGDGMGIWMGFVNLGF